MYITHATVVSGYPALLAGVALRDLARRGYFDRVPPSVRAELLQVIGDLEKAGRAWQRQAAGTTETTASEIPASSAVSAGEAAALLGVTARRARQLAPVLGGSKRRGAWTLDRSAVLAERQRRWEQVNGHQGPAA